MEIRHATLADVPEIRRLEVQASTAAHWSAAQYDALFADNAPPRIVLIAKNDDRDCNDVEVVGFLIARCLASEWEIENIVVADDRKRGGIGMALVRRLLSEAEAASVTAIILEVRESNEGARRLYESIGFTSEGRRRAYYREPAEDAIVYRRALQFCDKIP